MKLEVITWFETEENSWRAKCPLRLTYERTDLLDIDKGEDRLFFCSSILNSFWDIKESCKKLKATLSTRKTKDAYQVRVMDREIEVFYDGRWNTQAVYSMPRALVGYFQRQNPDVSIFVRIRELDV